MLYSLQRDLNEQGCGEASLAFRSAKALRSVGVGAAIFIPMKREFPRGKSEVGIFQSVLGMNHPCICLPGKTCGCFALFSSKEVNIHPYHVDHTETEIGWLMRRISVLRFSVICISSYELTRFLDFPVYSLWIKGPALGGFVGDKPSLKRLLCSLVSQRCCPSLYSSQSHPNSWALCEIKDFLPFPLLSRGSRGFIALRPRRSKLNFTHQLCMSKELSWLWHFHENYSRQKWRKYILHIHGNEDGMICLIFFH